jgi:uncharacterized membrane protein YoaK (UPF0700 family)
MVLHPVERLTTARNLTSWALFSSAAGAVNLGALLACERFVAHVTGTLTRVGADVGQVLGLDYLLVLLAFMFGAGLSIVIVRKFGSSDRAPAYWLPLSIVAALLLAVALLGSVGVFGRFGGTVETAHDFALLCILGCAMGMQNSAVASSTAMAVRTTHMTGPATDFAVAAAMLLTGKDDERTKALASLKLRGTKLASFAAGAAFMVPICNRFGFLAFLAPSAACLAGTLISFAPQRDTNSARAQEINT